ncbi:MAG: hypothetical protein ABIA93_05815 [Candidatus Woesearchaeota archaeon]
MILMKTQLLILLFVSAFLLAGCAQKAAYDCSDGTIVENAADCPPEELAPPEPEPQAPEPENETVPDQGQMLSPDVQAVFDKSAVVKSLQYTYTGPETTPAKEIWWITPEKAKVSLEISEKYYTDSTIDTVYFDRVTMKAVGYCEQRLAACKNLNTPQNVSYDEYWTETPLDWIAKVPASTVRKPGSQVDQRTTVKLEWEDDGTQWTMFVYDYFGLPIKIEARTPAETRTWTYYDTGVNMVKPEDLTHKMISLV